MSTLILKLWNSKIISGYVFHFVSRYSLSFNYSYFQKKSIIQVLKVYQREIFFLRKIFKIPKIKMGAKKNDRILNFSGYRNKKLPATILFKIVFISVFVKDKL